MTKAEPVIMHGIIGLNTSDDSTPSEARTRPVGPPPGNDVHDLVLHHRECRQDDRADTQLAVHGEHRRAGDQVGRRAVAVERDERCQHGGADADLHRVAVHDLEDLLDHRVEQAGVDHDAEEKDGEADHDSGRRHLLDAVVHHLAELGVVKAQRQGEENGDQDQRVHR